LGQLVIMSLNMWGMLAPLSVGRVERMEAFANHIREHGSEYDAIGLQEVWVERDRQMISEAGSAVGLSSSRYFKSGAMGSGLMIMSRHHIIYSNFHKFTVSGSPAKIAHMDWYAGKGVGIVVLDHRSHGPISLLNTHFHANYNCLDFERRKLGGADGRLWHDEYAADRTVQALEIAQLAAQHSRSNPAIVVGDFNSEPDGLEMAVFKGVSGMNDAVAASKSGNMSDEFTLNYMSPHNNDKCGKIRLDYVWASPEFQVVDASASVRFHQDAGSDEKVWFSDHLGVVARLTLAPGTAPASCNASTAQQHFAELPSDVKALVVEALEGAIHSSGSQNDTAMAFGFIFIIISILLTTYTCFIDPCFSSSSPRKIVEYGPGPSRPSLIAGQHSGQEGEQGKAFSDVSVEPPSEPSNSIQPDVEGKGALSPAPAAAQSAAAVAKPPTEGQQAPASSSLSNRVKAFCVSPGVLRGWATACHFVWGFLSALLLIGLGLFFSDKNSALANTLEL